MQYNCRNSRSEKEVPVYTLNPLFDPRWDVFVATHRRASIFHETGWLRALAKTYGFRPVVLTSAQGDDRLSWGLVFCEVKSWVTGVRLISLPFADHAEPLVDSLEDRLLMQEWVRAACLRDRWKYVELRPVFWEAGSKTSFVVGQQFWLHNLDLTPSLDQLFSRLHKDCFQRRIRHAERERLVYVRGRSDRFLNSFYKLQVITRRRHGILPQPRSWFQNLMAELGPSAEIRLAMREGTPIAALFTLRHRNTVVYKYGCSDEQYHHLAGMPFLFWKMIEESKAEGAERIDLGRTDMENRGLVDFKDRLGATRSKMSYLRYSLNENLRCEQASHLLALRSLLPSLPGPISSGLGRLVYRHIA